MIRIAIIYEPRLVAAIFALFITSQEELAVAGEICDGRGAVRLCVEERPDVVLLGATKRGTDTSAVVREVCRLLPQTAFLMLGPRSGDDRAFGASGSGIRRWYLREDCTPEELAGAIRAAAALPGTSGGAYGRAGGACAVSGSASGADGRLAAGVPRLTGREAEVLEAVARGKSSRQIAGALHLSERTVRNHLQNVYTKLGVNGRAQAIIHAVRHGLVDYAAVTDET